MRLQKDWKLGSKSNNQAMKNHGKDVRIYDKHEWDKVINECEIRVSLHVYSNRDFIKKKRVPISYSASWAVLNTSLSGISGR